MGELFLKVLNMSITAGYCALVVLLLRIFLRRQPKVYSYMLWAVVYFRMACPVSFESVFSLLKVRPQTIPQDVEVWGRTQAYTAQEQMAQLGVTDISVNAQTASAASRVDLLGFALSAAAVVWIAVAVFLIAHSVWTLLRLQRELKGAQPVGWNVYEARNLQTPFVFGLLWPRIFLPAHLPEPERSFVLAHERTHIRRRDYLVKQAAFLITCVHWFNPLAWISFYLMCRDMEMSCDENVIRGMGGEVKKEYSESLLALASGRQILNGSPLAFGEGGIRERITNVLRYRRPAFWVSMVFVAALSTVLIGLALNPVEAAPAGREMPATVTDKRMAVTSVALPDGGDVWLELWLLEGLYYDMEYAGPGGGIYEENYEGTYELRTVDASGNMLDARELNADWYGPDGGRVNFPGAFELAVTDYNLDGCMDFTVGTYGSSSVNLFYLYTVDAAGRIMPLCAEGIPAENTGEFSILFEHDTSVEGLPIYSSQWDNAKGESVLLMYLWNAETGMYEQKLTESMIAGGAYGDEVPEDTFSNAIAYDGYLDESPFSYWNQNWNDCDFDADGLRDRIYRTCSAEDLHISYRIEFGNGLEITVGEFEDCFTDLVIESADLTGNGEREILYVGMHGASTDPMAESEIALFTKVSDRYVRIPLPQPLYAYGDPSGEYAAGYSGLYFRDNGDGTVRLVAPELGYEETFALTEGEQETWDMDYRGPSEEVGGTAYDASFITYNGELCLALFASPGSKWYYHPVCFVLHPVLSASSVSPYGMELVDIGLVQDTSLTEYDFTGQERSFAGVSEKGADTKNPNGAGEGVWQGRASVGIPAHRSGFVEPTLHLYVPSSQRNGDYVNLDAMPEKQYRQLAVDALQDLYDLTGTQIEECYYYYTTLGSFWFARTEDDMERQRTFYHRSYSGTKVPEFGRLTIGTLTFANARRVWFSDVYQYELPADFDSYTDSEKAVWFLQHSGLYEGETIAECVQPYSYSSEIWHIRMAEGTAYEITLDDAIDSVADIAGPYPDWDISH